MSNALWLFELKLPIIEEKFCLPQNSAVNNETKYLQGTKVRGISLVDDHESWRWKIKSPWRISREASCDAGLAPLRADVPNFYTNKNNAWKKRGSQNVQDFWKTIVSSYSILEREQWAFLKVIPCCACCRKRTDVLIEEFIFMKFKVE